MTICVAALCEQRAQAVVVADRMATSGFGHDVQVQRDGAVTKLAVCSEATVFLHSGVIQCAEWMSQQISSWNEQRRRTSPREVFEQINQLATTLTTQLRDRAVAGILGEGHTFAELSRTMAASPSSNIHFNAWRSAAEREAGSFLIVGVASTPEGPVAQMYQVPLSSALGQLDRPFSAIGSGQYYALASFEIQRFTAELPLASALFATYCAKRAAELAVGVGRELDIKVISAEGIAEPSPEIYQELEKAFNQEAASRNDADAHPGLRDAVSIWHQQRSP